MAIALPDKCAHCGLRVEMKFKDSVETSEHDLAFGQLRVLYEEKIIKTRFTRRVEMTNAPADFGDTHYCAVSSAAWGQNEVACKYWALRIKGAGISDYLSIYNDRQNYRLAYWGVIVAAALAVAIAAIQAVV